MTRLLTLLVLAGLLTAAGALAMTAAPAAPKPGGFYSGASAAHHPIRLQLDKDGRGGVVHYCNNAFHARFRVHAGRFATRIRTAGGAVTEFLIRGHWTTRRLAAGWIDLSFGCDGRPGPWTATLRH